MASTQQQRTVPFKVICPGMSRSGTNSMHLVLETLGIGKTWHAFHFGDRPKDSKVWLDFLERKWPRSGDPADVRPITRADFDSILYDFGGVTDIPPAVFWPELMAAYPEAKIILVEREPADWYRSFERTLLRSAMSPRGLIVAHPLFSWLSNEYTFRLINDCFLRYFRAKNGAELLENAETRYMEHNEAIRQKCREENRPLLEYKLGSGVKPLCDFLGLETPSEVEFPKTNEAEITITILRSALMNVIVQAVVRVLTWSAAGSVIGAVAWTGLRNPELFGVWIGYLRFR